MTYPAQWEYQNFVMKGDLVGALNKAGKDSWEFCGVLGVVQDPGTQKVVGHHVLMKRPKALIDTDLTKAPKGLRV